MFDINITLVFNWWLVLLFFSMIGHLFVFHICPYLKDRGVFFARSMGWIAIGYVVWLASSLGIGYSKKTIILSIASVGLLSIHTLWKNRYDYFTFLKDNWRIILLSELIFTVSFFIFISIRILNPDLWHPIFGGEKFMELAYTNAILRSTDFPPYDPYFAGLSLNYYYYGFFLITVPIQLTGIPTVIAFNLAIATLFALTVCGLFGLGYNLCPSNRFSAGVRAVIAVAIFGNLAGGLQAITNLAGRADNLTLNQLPVIETLVRPILGLLEVLKSGNWPDYDFWAPSRVISHTINEFPYWSFVFADLHPHLIAIPFSLLFLAVMFNGYKHLCIGSTQPTLNSIKFLPGPITFWIVLSWVLGTIAVINTWDLITYFAFTTLLIFLNGLQSIRNGMHIYRAIGKAIAQSVFIVVVSLGSYAFFYLHFHPAAVKGIGMVGHCSNPIEWIGMWGFWLVIGGGYFLFTWCTLLLDRRISIQLLNRFPEHPIALSSGLLMLMSVGFGFFTQKWVSALLLLPLITGITVLGSHQIFLAKEFTHAILLLGFSLLMGIETLYIRDHLVDTDYYRMNTVFKFGIHAWVLLGLSAAVIWPELLRQIRGRWLKWMQRCTFAILSILFLLVSVYPILGTPARLNMRYKQKEGTNRLLTLDGMAYMKEGQYPWHLEKSKAKESMIVLTSDYEAIQWLQKNIKGTPVIAEAPIGYYRAGGLRACSFTGLPTPIGFHQRNEQRAASVTEPRYTKTVAMWKTTDPDLALQYLKELNVALIYVGTLEKIIYGHAAMFKFSELAASGKLKIRFQNEAVTIYQLV